MKKIITAINNPKLNEELKKEKNFEIIGKDIQYKEAILELLEKNKNIDLIIISEKIPGEIQLEKLIKKIKLINEKIKIIFILEKENNNLEKILIKNNILDIYYNNKINLNELIKIINKKEINMEEEIIKLKKIIEEKNINNNSEKNKQIKYDKLKNKYLEKIKNKIKVKIKKRIKKKVERVQNNNMLTKIITFSGNYKSGKSTLALIVSQYLAKENYKVLLVDCDLEKQDLSFILKAEKYRNCKKRKNKFKNNYFNKNNLKKNKLIRNKKIIIEKITSINKKIKLINKKNKIYNYKIKNNINLFTIKINKNLYFFYGLNYLLKNKINKKEKYIKKVIIVFLKLIEQNYDFVIIDISKNNLDIINKEILKNSNMNFILMEPNLLGVKEIQQLLKIYLNDWKILQKGLHIVVNKKNINSMNKNLISKCLPPKIKICEIKENKIYYILLNNYFRKNYLLKNKHIKKETDKIIKKIKNNSLNNLIKK